MAFLTPGQKPAVSARRMVKLHCPAGIGISYHRNFPGIVCNLLNKFQPCRNTLQDLSGKCDIMAFGQMDYWQ